MAGPSCAGDASAHPSGKGSVTPLIVPAAMLCALLASRWRASAASFAVAAAAVLAYVLAIVGAGLWIPRPTSSSARPCSHPVRAVS